MNYPTRFSMIVLMVAANAVTAVADVPGNLKSATIKPAVLQGNVSNTVRAIARTADDDDWIGYTVESRPGLQVCSGIWSRGKLSADLSDENEDGMSTNHFDEEEEGFGVERRLIVLLRVNNDRVDRVRVFTDDCPVKGAGSVVHWLDNVSGVESASYLAEIVQSNPDSKRQRERFQSRAAAALAHHADPAAVAALQTLIGTVTDDKLRGEVVFWIGESDSPQAVTTLLDVLDDDPSDHVREQAIFALSNNDSPEAVNALVQAARSHEDRDVRSKALFWLAQKAGDRAKETLRDAAIDDPDQYVKEQAVFALSQLPEDEGVPLLIDVARNNPNAKVREQAIFWLGQSEDPRALSFFEEILSR